LRRPFVSLFPNRSNFGDNLSFVAGVELPFASYGGSSASLSGIPQETYDYRLGTIPPLNGSSTNIKSQPTNAVASPTIPIAPKTRNIFCVSSAKSLP
jgi:hypothetical protein